ncbi:MAG: hypothetical protein HY347_10400 [candidate division NC10 bacterium]|nr:hypothetical protein [candidate division NC10 bacterium]
MAEEFIQIEGEGVSLYRRTAEGPPRVERSVSLSELLREVASSPGSGRDETLFLPSGTRFVTRNRGLVILVLEQPPQVKRLLWDAVSEQKRYEPRRLAFPYIVYLFLLAQGAVEEMRVYYRKAPLTSPRDELFLPNLMNVQVAPEFSSNCRACLRGRPEDLERPPMAEQVAALLDYFWSSGFNQDVEQNGFERAKGIDPRIASVERWEEATTLDPLFPLEVAWEPARFILQKVVDRLGTLRGTSGRPLSTASDLADLMYRLRELRTAQP